MLNPAVALPIEGRHATARQTRLALACAPLSARPFGRVSRLSLASPAQPTHWWGRLAKCGTQPNAMCRPPLCPLGAYFLASSASAVRSSVERLARVRRRTSAIRLSISSSNCSRLASPRVLLCHSSALRGLALLKTPLAGSCNAARHYAALSTW